MEEFNEEEQMRLQHYITIGAITIEGVDENGEIVFALHEDVARDLAPELWEAHMEYVDDAIIELYKNGLADVEYDENLEATIHLTEEGYKEAKRLGILPIEE